MTGIVERFVSLVRATIVALNGVSAVGASVKNMLMGEWHEKRCPHMDGDQGKDRDLLPNVLCHAIQCKEQLREKQGYRLIAFQSKNRYLDLAYFRTYHENHFFSRFVSASCARS